MKEQLFEILHNRKRMPGERFSDIEGKIESFVNQEVEKRIAERMPSERLRDELIKYDQWQGMKYCDNYRPQNAHITVNEYLKSRER